MFGTTLFVASFLSGLRDVRKRDNGLRLDLEQPSKIEGVHPYRSANVRDDAMVVDAGDDGE